MARHDTPPPGPEGGGWWDRDGERRSGERRSGEGRRPAGHRGREPLPHHIDVPDDLSELDDLVPGVRHELRWERRRRRVKRLIPKQPRWAWLVPLVALIATSLVVSMVLTLGSPHAKGQGSKSLAHPTAEPGRVGGLLPDVTVTGHTRAFPIRIRRPVALVLLPADCHCSPLLQRLSRRAAQYQLPIDVAVSADAGDRAVRMIERIGNGGTLHFPDPGGRLHETYDASGLTLVLVNPHGVVTQVARDLDRESLTSLDLARVRAGA